MNNDKIVSLYRDLLVTSRSMLAAVEQREWERFIALEATQSAITDQVRTERQPTGEEAVKAVKAIILEILDLQAKTSDLAIPWRDTIAAMMQSVEAVRTLNQHYGDGERFFA